MFYDIITEFKYKIFLSIVLGVKVLYVNIFHDKDKIFYLYEALKSRI